LPLDLADLQSVKNFCANISGAPRHATAAFLADPAQDPGRSRLAAKTANHAYTASKLCCILMAREIAARHPSYRPSAFDPGFLPQTQLMREAPKLVAAVVKPLISKFMQAKMAAI